MRRQVSPAVVVIVVIVVLLIIAGIWQYVYQRPPVPPDRRDKVKPREGRAGAQTAVPGAQRAAPVAPGGAEVKPPEAPPEGAAPTPEAKDSAKGQ